MGKKVIMCEAGKRLYRTLEEASEDFVLSPGEISRRISSCEPVLGGRARWADRVFAVRLKDGRFVICIRDSRNRLVTLDGKEKLRNRDVVEVRDITVAWYYPKEEW